MKSIHLGQESGILCRVLGLEWFGGESALILQASFSSMLANLPGQLSPGKPGDPSHILPNPPFVLLPKPVILQPGQRFREPSQTALSIRDSEIDALGARQKPLYVIQRLDSTRHDCHHPSRMRQSKRPDFSLSNPSNPFQAHFTLEETVR